MTFTKAAAAEMRERIGAAIEAECEKDPQNTHLRRQSALNVLSVRAGLPEQATKAPGAPGQPRS